MSIGPNSGTAELKPIFLLAASMRPATALILFLKRDSALRYEADSIVVVLVFRVCGNGPFGIGYAAATHAAPEDAVEDVFGCLVDLPEVERGGNQDIVAEHRVVDRLGLGVELVQCNVGGQRSVRREVGLVGEAVEH